MTAWESTVGPQATAPRRVAIYARVSHENDQDPESQLQPLRRFVADHPGWTAAGEYVDRCGALDLRGRVAWGAAMDAARRRQIDLIVVWKLDRAFRSTLHALGALRRLEAWGVGFVCTTQPIDTTNAVGRYILTGLAAAAEFERELISERTKAGLARARAGGKVVGRPKGSKDRRKRRSPRPKASGWPADDGIPA